MPGITSTKPASCNACSLPMRTAGKTNGKAAEASTCSTVCTRTEPSPMVVARSTVFRFSIFASIVGSSCKSLRLNLIPESAGAGWIVDRGNHQGFVALFDGTTGEPRAIMNAGGITAIRTAAVSGVAHFVRANDEAVLAGIRELVEGARLRGRDADRGRPRDAQLDDAVRAGANREALVAGLGVDAKILDEPDARSGWYKKSVLC